jgi:hypothetical protein
MAAAIDIKPMLRFRNVQFLEKHIRHVGVKMLAGVDHDLVKATGFTDGTADRSRLDELRAGADDGDNLPGQV